MTVMKLSFETSNNRFNSPMAWGYTVYLYGDVIDAVQSPMVPVAPSASLNS